jgi:hypothetical protein
MPTPAVFGGPDGNKLLPPEGMDDIKIDALNVEAGLDVKQGIKTDTLTVGGVPILPPTPDPTIAKFGGESGNELMAPGGSPDGDIKIRRLNVTEGLDVRQDILTDGIILCGKKMVVGDDGIVRAQ